MTPSWLLLGCIWNVERFYSLTRRTLFLAENTREHLSRHPGGRSGNRGVKSNGFNFSLDSSTSLLLYTQLVIYVAEPLVHLPPPFRGLAFLGGFRTGTGCWSERHVRVRQTSHRNRDVRLRNAFSKWTETKGYPSESERKTMAGPSDVPQGSFSRGSKKEGKNF